MSKIKVVLIVTGFPTDDNPSHGVFNKRAADLLSEYVDLSVIQLRVLRPGKRILTLVEEFPYRHYTLSAPFLPHKPFFICKHLSLYKKFGNNRLNSLLLHTNIFHSVGASFAGILGSLWAENYRKRNIVQLIGTDVNSELKELLNLKCVKALKEFTYGVGANTNDLKEKFEELLGVKENIKVVYRGIDVSNYKYSFPDGSKVRFLFLGGIPDYKHVESGRNLKGGLTLMESWKSIEKELSVKGCELTFAGPDSDSQDVIQWKETLKHPANVHLKGILTPQEVLQELNNSHVLLIPSLEEGMPNVALEGGATGKCIIASRVGGLPELIDNNENGVLINPGSAEELGNCLVSFAGNIELIKEMGIKIREKIKKDFNVSNFVPGYLNIYENAMKMPIRS